MSFDSFPVFNSFLMRSMMILIDLIFIYFFSITYIFIKIYRNFIIERKNIETCVFLGRSKPLLCVICRNLGAINSNPLLSSSVTLRCHLLRRRRLMPPQFRAKKRGYPLFFNLLTNASLFSKYSFSEIYPLEY